MGVSGQAAGSPPILEFDPTREAVIEPSVVVARRDVPSCAVLCFFQNIIERVVREHEGRELMRLRSEMGDNPIYEIRHGDHRLAIVHPGVGAPLVTGFLEELIALGCSAFVAAGGAGVLVPELALGHVIVPTAAVRDEGTSYHYLPPSREVAANPEVVAAIVATLERHKVPFVTGKTWTTDGWLAALPKAASPSRWRQRRASQSPLSEACGSASSCTRATTCRVTCGMSGPGSATRPVARSCSGSPPSRSSA